MSESDAGVSHKIVLGAGRQAYLVCIEGGLTIGAPDGEVTLDQRDAVELVAPKKGHGACVPSARFLNSNPRLAWLASSSRHMSHPSHKHAHPIAQASILTWSHAMPARTLC